MAITDIHIALDDRVKLGLYLKNLRVKNKLTQKELSELSEISIRTITCLESGKSERGTKMEIINALSKNLKVEPELIFRERKR